MNVVGNGMTALLAHADAACGASAPTTTLVPAAVEELIRYDSPLQLFERTALADTEMRESRFAAGTKIAALLGAANRDPAVFARADAFDVARADNPHIGFGAGIHFCVGAPLARVELQTSLRTLLRRFPRLALHRTPSSAVRSSSSAGYGRCSSRFRSPHMTLAHRLAGTASRRAGDDGPRLRAVLAVPGGRGRARRRRAHRRRLQRRERLLRPGTVRRVRAGVCAARIRRRAAGGLRLRRLPRRSC